MTIRVYHVIIGLVIGLIIVAWLCTMRPKYAPIPSIPEPIVNLNDQNELNILLVVLVPNTQSVDTPNITEPNQPTAHKKSRVVWLPGVDYNLRPNNARIEK